MNVQEIRTRRTPTARHYNMGGRRVAEVYSGTVLHYRDGREMRTVDMRLQPFENEHFSGLQADRAGYYFLVGRDKRRGEDGWVSLGGGRGHNWISFRLAAMAYTHPQTGAYTALAQAQYDREMLHAASRKLTLADGREVFYASDVTWGAVFDGVDLRWRVEGGGVKEEVVIGQAAFAALPDSQYGAEAHLALVFELETVSEPTFSVDSGPGNFTAGFTVENGVVEIKSAAGELFARMPADAAYSTGKVGTFTERKTGVPLLREEIPLRKQFSSTKDGRHWLTVSVPLDRLRALPAGDIVIDPTVTMQPDGAASKDVWHERGRPSQKFGAGDGLHVRRDVNDQYGQRNAFLRFDLSGIPSGSICTSARLTLTNYWNGAFGATIVAYPMLFDWNEAQLNWYQYDNGLSWPGSAGANTPGVDYDSSVILAQFTGPTKIYGKVTANLNTAVVAAWFGASPTRANYGMTLRTTNGGNNLYGGEAAVAERRPKLVIEYTEAVVSSGGATAAAFGGDRYAIAAARGFLTQFGIVRLPPIPVTTFGNLFWQTSKSVIAAALLMTQGDDWVMVDGAGDPQTYTLRVTRQTGYLVPQ